jgi:hypothetical protein
MHGQDRLAMFLNKAKLMHPNLDFSLVENCVKSTEKIKIICHKKDYSGKEHGVFEITPSNLLRGKGCPRCKGKSFSSEDRKIFASIKHNWKYDYSKSDFSSVKKKTIVICPIHGEFEVSYDHHFNNNIGCKYCSYPSRDTSSFIREAKEKHHGYYSYNKINYKNSHKKVIITCPIHGDFEQTPNAHLNGQGCPKCATKLYKLERRIIVILEENNIDFVNNFSPKWLKTDKGGQSSLDFYIPSIKLGIECQGRQHFGYGGWVKNFNFKERFNIDKWKQQKCQENGIQLVYFANEKEMPKQYLGKIFTNENELMNLIRYLYKNNE